MSRAWAGVASIVLLTACESGRVGSGAETVGGGAAETVGSGAAALEVLGELSAGRREAELMVDSLAVEFAAHSEELESYSRTLLALDKNNGVLKDAFRNAEATLHLRLRGYLTRHPQFQASGITLFDRDGQPLSSVLVFDRGNNTTDLVGDIRSEGKVPSDVLRQQQWFFQPITRQKPVWSDPWVDEHRFMFDSGDLGWIATRSVPLLRDGAIYAIVSTDMVVPPPDGVPVGFHGADPKVWQPKRPTEVDDSAWAEHVARSKSSATRREFARRGPAEVALSRLASQFARERGSLEKYADPALEFMETEWEKDPLWLRLRDYIEGNKDFFGASITLLSETGTPEFSVYAAIDRDQESEVSLYDHLDPFFQVDITKQSWFTQPRSTKLPAWTGPYADVRANFGLPVWLVTRSVPLLDGVGRVWAIVSTDLEVRPPEGAPPIDPCKLYRPEMVAQLCRPRE